MKDPVLEEQQSDTGYSDFLLGGEILEELSKRKISPSFRSPESGIFATLYDNCMGTFSFPLKFYMWK